MNYNDTAQIEGMFPCLLQYIPSDVGLMCERLVLRPSELSPRKQAKYGSHYIEFVMMEMDRCEWAKWESVAIRLYFGKRQSGELFWRLVRFPFIPDNGFRMGSSILHEKYEDEFMHWWDSVVHILLAKQFAEKQVGVFKQELIQRTEAV